MASSWRAAAAAGAGRGGNFIKDYYNNPTECARALFPFISRQKDELSFNAGDVLEVISRDEGDWWVLRSAAHRVGLAPGNYFELIPPTELIGGDASVVSQPQQQQLASKSAIQVKRGLPPGWGSAIDPETGDEYYFQWGRGESQWEPPDFEFECEETVSTLSCDVGDAHDDCVEEEEEGPGPESGDDAGMAMAMMALIAAPDHEGARREEKENEEEMGTEEVEQLHDGGHKFAETDVPMDAEDFVQQAIADWIDEDSNNQEEEEPPPVIEFSASKRDLLSHQHLPPIAAVPVQSPRVGNGAHTEGVSPRSLMRKDASPVRLPPISLTAMDSPGVSEAPVISCRVAEEDAPEAADDPLERNRSKSVLQDSQPPSPNYSKMPDALRKGVVVPQVPRADVSESRGTEPHIALDYVHGYNGDVTTRNALHQNIHSSVAQKTSSNRLNKNVFWLNEYIILFPAATIVVAMSVLGRPLAEGAQDEYLPQQFFSFHTDEVTAVAVHRGDPASALPSSLVASGQTGKVGKVFIWNPSQMIDSFDRSFHSDAPVGQHKEVSKMAIVREIEMTSDCRGIHTLSFSPDGFLLLVLGMDEGRTMYVYNSVAQDSEAEAPLAKIRLGYNDLSYVGFNSQLYIPFGTADSSYGKSKKRDPNPGHNHDRILESGGGCYTITSCRNKSVKFWTFHQYRELAQGIVEVSGFKGRRVPLPKRLQQWTTKHSLVGATSFLPRGKSNARFNDAHFEITCCCIVKDGEGSGTSLPTARILTGTSTGAIFVWRQEEATEADDIYSIILGGSKSHGRAHRGKVAEDIRAIDILNAGIFWKPKGVFLYIITDLHDSGIIDIDHWIRPDSSRGILLTTGRDRTVNLWYMSNRDQSGIPVDHVNTFRLASSSDFQHATTVHDSQLGLSSSEDAVAAKNAAQSILDASIGGMARSVSVSPDGSHAIVGSTGNCIFLMNNLLGGEKQASMYCIHRCHVGSATRIALHPDGDLYLTTSSDKTVRIWSALRKRQLGLIFTREQVACGAFSGDGHVALGLGSLGSILLFRLDKDDQGMLNPTLVLRKNVVSAKGKEPGGGDTSPSRNSNGRNAKPNPPEEKRDPEIADMAYSPNGSVLAVALNSGKIYLLSVEEKYKRLAVCKGHTYAISRLTFSTDSALILSADSGSELVYWNAITGQQIMNVRSLRDVDWVAWNFTCGWPVEGLIRDSEPGLPADLVTLFRPSGSKYVLAGNQATTQGETLRLCPFPYTDATTPDFGRYVGHSAVAADVAMTKPLIVAQSTEASVFAMSVGGTGDACVLQWKLQAPL